MPAYTSCPSWLPGLPAFRTIQRLAEGLLLFMQPGKPDRPQLKHQHQRVLRRRTRGYPGCTACCAVAVHKSTAAGSSSGPLPATSQTAYSTLRLGALHPSFWASSLQRTNMETSAAKRWPITVTKPLLCLYGSFLN